MTIGDDAAPFMASMTRLPGDTVGLLSITRTKAAVSSAQPAPQPVKQHTIFNVIFDNSASMGESTRLGLEAIIRPLLRRKWFNMTLLTLFDVDTHTYQVPDEAALAHIMKSLPRQRRTNITVGVEDSSALLASYVQAVPVHENVHVLTMLLTDGAHNEGAPITKARAMAVRDGLLRDSGRAGLGNLHHTVLAFCLTNSSDAAASMIVKEVLETARIPELPNVFYAKTHADMTASLQSVAAACEGIFDGKARGEAFSEVALAPGTQFIATGTQQLTHRFAPMETDTFVVTLRDADTSGWVSVNGRRIPVAVLPVGSNGVSIALAAVREALQPLTRQAIAFDVKAIDERLVALEQLVAAVDAVAASEKTSFAARSLAENAVRTPAERRALLKRVVSAQYGIHEIRNALSALRVRSRSNSESISLLTGNQGKFAHVASKRSGTESRTAEMVAKDTTAVGAKLAELLRADAAAAVATGIADFDGMLPPTAITLQSNLELLRQWVEPGDDERSAAGTSADEAIMDVLSTYGIAAYPVQLRTSDATQVDLMQLGVTDVCTQLADSASMMMSWRMNSPIKFADGKTYTELLLLVDPALPRASTHALADSMLVQHLLSVMISKDLYMYLPPMHASMHTHAFATTVHKAITLAPTTAPPLGSFLRVAIHTVYSARKLWEARVIFEDMGNFGRWMHELETLTRSDADKVYHVNALSLKFALQTVDLAQVDDSRAVLNQMTEHLARRLKHATGKYAAPAAFAQHMFAIDAADAPQPTGNDLEAEPDDATVRARCIKHIPAGAIHGAADALQQLGDDCESLRSFVEAEWLPLFRMHQFSLALHAAVEDAAGSMDRFTTYVERHAGIPAALTEGVQRRLAAAGTHARDMWSFLGIEPKDVPRVCAAAVMQACLYPDTADRCGVVHAKDVTDPAELRAMTEELYMLHYRVACGFKAARRNAVIGEVTSLQAASSDAAVFSDMIGTHTHGHCKKVFWGMLRGVLADASAARRAAKLEVFRAKSSKMGFDSVLRKAGHR